MGEESETYAGVEDNEGVADSSQVLKGGYNSSRIFHRNFSKYFRDRSVTHAGGGGFRGGSHFFHKFRRGV